MNKILSSLLILGLSIGIHGVNFNQLIPSLPYNNPESVLSSDISYSTLHRSFPSYSLYQRNQIDNQMSEEMSDLVNQADNFIKSAYTSMDSIQIYSNSEFSTYAYSGDGSKVTPWNISGYEFTGEKFIIIDIQNTTDYFVFTDNYMGSGSMDGHGIHLNNVRNGKITNNILLYQHWYAAVYLNSSGNCTISGNTINSQELYNTIILHSSDNNIISNNTVENQSVWDKGTFLDQSDNNTISGNDIKSIDFSNSSNNKILSNIIRVSVLNNSDSIIFSGNSVGWIRIYNSGNYTISGNSVGWIDFFNSDNITFSGNGVEQIRLSNSGNYTISGNTINSYITLGHSNSSIISGNSINGRISLAYSSSNIISGNTINGTKNKYGGIYPPGISLYNSRSNTIWGNNIIGTKNKYGGISLSFSNRSTISGNTITNGTYGISLDHSEYNLISRNIIANNSLSGISLVNSGNQTITYNQISNNSLSGISLENSGNSIINNNVFTNNALFFINIKDINDYPLKEVLNNTVNDKPIIFLLDIEDYAVPKNVGQIIIGNSKFIQISNLNFLNSFFDPIILFYCETVRIFNNKISNSNAGMYLYGISKGSITNNIIQDVEGYGIHLIDSNNINIRSNIIERSKIFAIYIESSNNNIISWNDIIDTYNDGSQAFVDNRQNEFSYNYWNDWIEPDKNSDCIVDIAYPIDGYLETDRTPFAYPIAKTSPNENNFCKIRAQISIAITENKTIVTIFAALIVILVILVFYKFYQRVKKRRTKRKEVSGDIYPKKY